MQNSLLRSVTFKGVGLHSGEPVTMTVRPAGEDHGIWFRRTDLVGVDPLIPARWDAVVPSKLCTLVANAAGSSVSTIEHIMAALAGSAVHNALIDIDGPEVPIMDGSAQPFVEAIDMAGLQVQSTPRRAIRVLKEIVVTEGDKTVRLKPSVIATFTGQIEYPHPDIGAQKYEVQLFNGNFRHDIADCRTFGFLKDVEVLRAAGLGC